MLAVVAGAGDRADLLAGHIKPWRDSGRAERLDPRNGLAACPAHDVAFDTGMITVNGGLRIHLADYLAGAVEGDPLARQFYGRPPPVRGLPGLGDHPVALLLERLVTCLIGPARTVGGAS